MMAITVLKVLPYVLKRSRVLLGGVLALHLGAQELTLEPLRQTFTTSQLKGEPNILQVAQAGNHQFLAAGQHVGFYQNGQWEFLPGPKKEAIRGLLVDGDKLWSISTNEIAWTRLPLTSASRFTALHDPKLKSAGNFWQLAKSGNYLVATTDQEVWVVHPATQTVNTIPLPNEHRLVLISLQNRTVVAQPGLRLWEIIEGKLVPFTNPLPDSADTFWLWADDDYIVTAMAIYRRENGEYRRIMDARPLNKNVITSVARWNGYLAIASYAKGLFLFDPSSGKISEVGRAFGESAQNLMCVFVDDTNRLWVGSNQGLTLFESLEFGHRIEPRRFVASAFRQNGLLLNFDDHATYYLSSGVVQRLDRSYAAAPTRHGLALGFWGKVLVGEQEFQTPTNVVTQIQELPDGTILANAGGFRLYRLNLETASATLALNDKAGVSVFGVADGKVWIATREHELLQASASAPSQIIKVAVIPGTPPTGFGMVQGTPIFASPDQVTAGLNFAPVEHTAGLRNARLAETEGVLWLTGMQGGMQRLGRLARKHDAVVWEVVEAKGLSSLSEVHSFSANDGILTFCGDSSVLELSAARLQPVYQLQAPSLSFTVYDALTKRSTLSPVLPHDLTATANTLTFTGTATFDEFGEKPAFERRLLPTETAWVATSIGEVINYPSLSARTYTLQVRTTHLGQTGSPASYTFTVLPPWYLSKTAAATYAVLIVLAGYLGYRLRTRQILQRNQELELLIQERTRDLAKASAAKTEFLASMSHEIRNPMNGVLGLVNILREQSLGNPRQMHTLKLLHNCADQLRSTVDDILDFSKIEAGKIALESVTFNLLDTLEAASATVDPSQATIRFLAAPDPHLLLKGDAGKLRQIFANYLSNALKYGVPPEARVSTILTPTPAGMKLTLSVTSSGPTIDKDTLDKFFDSFTRGDEAVERNIRGTGLGLAICRRYAIAMGGDVGAVSNNGETTFYLSVPFERENAALAPAPIPALPASSLPAKALAIEDEDYNRIVLGNILEKMNYTVDWATTGQEALRLARENGYDIILTDYRLPDTNGVDLAKQILALCPHPKPAVFAVTAYSTRERRQECLDAGMSGFISKPITLEKLRSTLASWGEKNLAKLSLETSRPAASAKPPSDITDSWNELLRVAHTTDRRRAADLAHRLNNLCRSHYYFDLAEQLELLEGAIERGESPEKLIHAIERLMTPHTSNELARHV